MVVRKNLSLESGMSTIPEPALKFSSIEKVVQWLVNFFPINFVALSA
jgi:hypothetical protein